MVKPGTAQVVDGRIDHFCVKNFTRLLSQCFANVVVVDLKARDVACVARNDS